MEFIRDEELHPLNTKSQLTSIYVSLVLALLISSLLFKLHQNLQYQKLRKKVHETKVKPPFGPIQSFNATALVLSYYSVDQQVFQLLNILSKNSSLYSISHKEFIMPFLAQWSPKITKRLEFGNKLQRTEASIKLPNYRQRDTKLSCIKLKLQTMKQELLGLQLVFCDDYEPKQPKQTKVEYPFPEYIVKEKKLHIDRDAADFVRVGFNWHVSKFRGLRLIRNRHEQVFDHIWQTNQMIHWCMEDIDPGERIIALDYQHENGDPTKQITYVMLALWEPYSRENFIQPVV